MMYSTVLLYYSCIQHVINMLEGKWNGNLEKDWDGAKTDGEKEDRGPNGDVGIEGNSGSDGNFLGQWSKMVQACVEGGWWACFEKSIIGVWSEG